MPRALITGIGGQDGSLLAELLLEEDYEVLGTVHRPADAYENLDGLRSRIRVVAASAFAEIDGLLRAFRPDEIYNLAAPSFVPRSWEEPLKTARSAGLSAVDLFDAARAIIPETRIYQASSSEIFGIPESSPQNEATAIRPRTPYGAAKAYAHFMAQVYRERYGMFICCGIAYNHESPRRSIEFLPRKIVHAAVSIALGYQSEVAIGNVYAERDWGYAPDYVRGMHLMLRQDTPADYVLATGVSHAVADLCAEAFSRVRLEWTECVRSDAELQRGPDELSGLLGDARRARDVLGWQPSVDFHELVVLLVDAELERLREPLASGRAAR